MSRRATGMTMKKFWVAGWGKGKAPVVAKY
jgi:hypothetical protein